MAHVEIVPPKAVTDTDQRTAWRIPTMPRAPRFAIQRADDLDAAYRRGLRPAPAEARDGRTWRASGGLVATWFVRPVSSGSASALAPPLALEIPGETGGLELLFMVGGSPRSCATMGRKSCWRRATA